MPVFTRLRDVTPESLTTALRESGTLADGVVRSIKAKQAFVYREADVYHLRLKYAPKQAGPKWLFIKFTHDGHKELYFYQRVAPQMAGVLDFIPLVHAGAEADGLNGHLILHNLRKTHTQTEWPLPPTLKQAETAMTVLARLHSHWWNAPGLAELELKVYENRWRTRIHEAVKAVPNFLLFLGNRLPHTRVEVLKNIAARWRELETARLEQGPISLVHGDAHAWNFLFPKHDAGSTVLFDWHGWDIDLPTHDLAYFMALHWYPELRERYEAGLLKRYSQLLSEHGVQGYSHDDLLADYRLSVIRNLLIPVWQWTNNLPAAIWWGHLERGMLAFQDLNCKDILYS